MTDAELVAAGRKLYEQILAIPFGHDEMLAFGQAVFSKTPWGALTPTGKIAMFRLTAALTPPAQSLGSIPDAEIVDRTAEESPSPAEAIANEGETPPPRTDNTALDPTNGSSE